MNEELKMFRTSVRDFIKREFVPHQARWREQHMPDRQAWTQAGDVGLLLTDIPQEYGGGGGTFAHEAVVLEELAAQNVHFGVREQSIVSHYILSYGSEEQKRKYLPRMASGELVGAIAMTEPSAGSDLQGMKTMARKVDGQYVISGSKTFITNGYHANLICLAVKTNPKGGPTSISLILIETEGLAGYSVGKSLEKIGVHGQDTCELFFDDVKVPAANLVGQVEGRGLAQMMEQLPKERLAIGIAAVTTAEAAIAITTTYAKQRIQFGKPLLELQNTRFKLAECKTETAIGRVFIDSCIQRFICKQMDASTAAMAKWWLTALECRVVDQCVQLHGGYGYMVEYPIARMWLDSRMHPIGGGTNEIMKEVIGWSL